MPTTTQSPTETLAKAGAKALDTLHNGISDAREQLPDAFSRAAAQVEQLTRRGADHARSASLAVKSRALRASDSTIGYIKDEPVKAVLVAAAAGAALALLVRALSRRESA